MKRFVSVFVASVALVGCAAAPPAKMATPFDDVAHEAYRGVGTATIKGQGFLRQRGGGTVTCAGSAVYLMPSTPYFREIVRVLQTRRTPETGGRAFSDVMRKSQCDAQGNFAFTNIPAAEWIVTTDVVWTVRYSSQGGGLVRNVTSVAGQTTTVLLTDSDRL